MSKIRLIVADDSPLFLQKFVSVLAVEFDIVATAEDGNTALDLIHRHKPDLVVLDLYMPGLNGTFFQSARSDLLDGDRSRDCRGCTESGSSRVHLQIAG